METPSSIRRITRSQAVNKCIPMSRKNEDSAGRQSKVTMDRSALFDITNDSPIVGLAMGSKGTPSSLAKKDQKPKQTTPGSGEALLRGQVKILLQQVEEEGDVSKLSGGGPLKGSLNYSPSGLLAPTPANTPQVPNLSDLNTTAPPPEQESEEEIYQEAAMLMDEDDETHKQPSLESERSDVTRALLFDFLEKSEISSDCSSVVTEGSVSRGKLTEEDDASVWSIQVNASTRDEEEEEETEFQEEDEEEEDADYDEAYGGEGGELVNELCEGLSNIFVQKKPVNFEGKHTRFVYNSDGEIEDEVVISDKSSSSGILRLNGLPTPQGKHLRFPEEE